MKTLHFFQTIPVVLLIVVLATVFMTDAQAETLSLEGPSFISAKRAGTQQVNSSFPEEEAGMCAYVKVDEAMDIEKLMSAFSQVEDVGENYILGVVPIPNFNMNTDVRLYADIDGWLVAYFRRDAPASMIMQWHPASINTPSITKIHRTTLGDALTAAGNAARVSALPTPNYYHFKYPYATHMMIIVKARATNGKDIVQVKIPESYTLYDASYYCYFYAQFSPGGGGDSWWSSTFKVDGVTVSSFDSDRSGGYDYPVSALSIRSYDGRILTGTLHTIEISYVLAKTTYTNRADDIGSAGVATILIYKGTE